MRRSHTVTLILCGTSLVLMPQIHHAVISANVLYARAVATRYAESAEAAARQISEPAPPGWMAWISTGVGVVMIGAGVMGTMRWKNSTA